MHRPVVLLKKALHGHPNAGSFWEKECAERLKTLGWVTAADEWPSVFWHPTYRLLLTVYVDDCKMAGPKENHAKAWVEIRRRIAMSDVEGPWLYLGCKQVVGTVKFAEGTTDRSMTYDMSDFFDQCVDVYLQLTGLDRTTLRKVSTLFLPEDQTQSPTCGVVSPGEPWFERGWCKHPSLSRRLIFTDPLRPPRSGGACSPGLLRTWEPIILAAMAAPSTPTSDAIRGRSIGTLLGLALTVRVKPRSHWRAALCTLHVARSQLHLGK